MSDTSGDPLPEAAAREGTTEAKREKIQRLLKDVRLGLPIGRGRFNEAAHKAVAELNAMLLPEPAADLFCPLCGREKAANGACYTCHPIRSSSPPSASPTLERRCVRCSQRGGSMVLNGEVAGWAHSGPCPSVGPSAAPTTPDPLAEIRELLGGEPLPSGCDVFCDDGENCTVIRRLADALLASRSRVAELERDELNAFTALARQNDQVSVLRERCAALLLRAEAAEKERDAAYERESEHGDQQHEVEYAWEQAHEARRELEAATTRIAQLETQFSDALSAVEALSHGNSCSIHFGGTCDCWKAIVLRSLATPEPRDENG